MPEAVELRVRGRKRSRMAVPERHDCDTSTEVEVLAPVVVPDAAAVAVDDRHVGSRIRWQEPVETH
jgi:hypothetical protein